MADDQNPQLPLTPPPGDGGIPGAANIQPVNIEEEMRRSYLDYSMSVIIGRALPDVRDGLKPVHRRILYHMHDMGLLHNRKYVKCAKVVGETLYNMSGSTGVPGRRAFKIALADLDLDATIKANEERGLEFHLPVKKNG